MSRFINACFTVNNWTQEDKDRLVISDQVTYVCYAEEVGENGTPHLQGYVEFNKQYGLRAIKNIIGERAHVEKRKGNQRQAIDYCKKVPPYGIHPNGDNVVNDVFFEFGEKKEQGKRKDIEFIYEQVELQDSMTKILEIRPTYTQIKLAEKLYQYKGLSKGYKKREVIWCFGATETGKTRYAYENIPIDGDFWVSNDDGSKWFDGYTGQDYVIIDELRAGTWPYRTMLRLLDGYAMRVPVKGSYYVWNPSKVVITTPFDPETTYAGQITFGDGSIKQLKRRITKIIHFKIGNVQEILEQSVVKDELVSSGQLPEEHIQEKDHNYNYDQIEKNYLEMLDKELENVDISCMS